MKIKIIETGELEELTIIDPKTCCDFISDLMGNHGELPDYDDEIDANIMNLEAFEWWRDLTANLQAAEYRYDEIRNNSLYPTELDDKKTEFIGSCDLEDLPGLINHFCDEVEHEATRI